MDGRSDEVKRNKRTGRQEGRRAIKRASRQASNGVCQATEGRVVVLEESKRG